jgi:adenylyltransferase/sulfurtransferase
MTLTAESRERYSRMLRLHDFSEKDIKRIRNTRVAVVGAGGLGSPTLRLLTSVGFGRIRIVDCDKVELSNVQRQNIYNTEDIGKPKAITAAENLARLNPEVEFEPVAVGLDDNNAFELVRGADLAVDGLDSFRARRALNKATLRLQIPYVFAGAVEYFANLSTFIPGHTPCFACVMGNARDNPKNTAAVRGVDPCLLSVAAGIEAREAILLSTGKEPGLKNRLMTVDITSLSFDTFEIRRSEDCPVCEHLGAKE